MFAANVKIIEALKAFVQLVVSDREVLNHFCVCHKDFTRERKLPFERLVLVIVRLCKKTLSVELEKFFEQAGCLTSCSVSAFSQQRIKLLPLFFYMWNLVLLANYYLFYGRAVKRWKSYRIIAADGSSVGLVENEALQNYFGGQHNQLRGYVLARTFYHYDVLNELIVFSQMKPWRWGELNMAYRAVESIEEDMLMLYDRNFGYYKMLALLLWQERERKFVIRARENQKWIRAFLQSGAVSEEVVLFPTAAAIEGLRQSGFIVKKATPLKLRLVRVELAQTVEVLITNLWEREGYSGEELKELYFLRWGVETNISVQKNILQLESFSGLTVAAVLQDFYATVMMANLHAVLIKEAQSTIEKTTTHRKHPMKVNKNKSFGKLKATLVWLFLNKEVPAILQTLHDYFIRYPVPVRKGRSYKRRRKNTRGSKYKTFTNFKPAY